MAAGEKRAMQRQLREAASERNRHSVAEDVSEGHGERANSKKISVGSSADACHGAIAGAQGDAQETRRRRAGSARGCCVWCALGGLQGCYKGILPLLSPSMSHLATFCHFSALTINKDAM